MCRAALLDGIFIVLDLVKGNSGDFTFFSINPEKF